jgi:hypothetical protein
MKGSRHNKASFLPRVDAFKSAAPEDAAAAGRHSTNRRCSRCYA